MEGMLKEQLAALEGSRAFTDASSFRKVQVRGDQALPWLHELVTSDVGSLQPGGSRRALLLTPTGRIRADFVVSRTEDRVLLLQDDAQPNPIDQTLSPYVLGSGVELADMTPDLSLFCVIGAAAERVGHPGTRPSVLGDGMDLVGPANDAWRVGSMLMKKQLTEVGSQALEVRRVLEGRVRFPIDLDEASMPSEAGLDELIDITKGCFLGQEAVARVRNLGHPPRVILHMRAEGPAAPGDKVHAGPSEVGVVTSAATIDGITTVLVRVRWVSAEAPLSCGDGVRLKRIERVRAT
jgi:folate-binding protein YgfZ